MTLTPRSGKGLKTPAVTPKDEPQPEPIRVKVAMGFVLTDPFTKVIYSQIPSRVTKPSPWTDLHLALGNLVEA